MHKRLLTSLFFLICCQLQGQRYNAYLENITVEHGLSDNSVYSFFQDNKGFMWIGTHTGLTRYDGYTFKEYEISLRDKEATPVTKIVADHLENLWVATSGSGLYRLNENDQKLTKFTPENNEPLIGETIYDILITEDKSVWITTEVGVFVHKHEVLPYFAQVHFVDKKDKLISNITKIEEGNENQIFLSSQNGQLLNASLTDFSFQKRIISCTELSSGFPIDNFFYDKKTTLLWMSSWSRGVFTTKDSEKLKNLTHNENDKSSLSSNQITDIVQGPNGAIWVSTYDRGLNLLDNPKALSLNQFINNKSAVRHTKFQNVSEVLNKLTDYHIRALFFDKTGVLWIATENSGILKLEVQHEVFRYFQQDSHIDNTLAHRDISFPKITKDGGLWIGTWGGGLHYLSPQEALKTSPNYKRFQPINGDTTSISFPRVFPVFEDQKENLWLGTNGGGLNLLVKSERYKESPKFIRYQHNPSDKRSLNDNSVRSIFEDKKGNIWIGTDKGLNKFIPEQNGFSHYLEDILAYTIEEGDEEKLWLGTRKSGLIAWNPIQNSIEKHDHFILDEEQNELLEIHHVTIDKNGMVWLGGADGFFSFNPDTKQFTQFTEEDGIPTGQLESIEVDQRGRMWIGTWETGLYLFEPSKQKFTPFKMSQGSMGNSFTQGASQSADGTLYFGSRNGFYSFHPDSVQIDEKLPEVLITGIQGGENIMEESLVQKANESQEYAIQFDYNNNAVSISFSALTYDINTPVRYSYQLSDIDENPRLTNFGEHNVTYPNLQPGAYTFTIKAIGRNKQSSEKKITLIINPPWWKTTWSYSIYFIIIVLALLKIRQYRKAKLKREQDVFREKVEREKEERLQQIKLDFFTNISHEIKTPLTLIKAPVENILNSKDLSSENIQYAALIKSNTERLLRLTNQLLDYRKVSLSQMPVNYEVHDLITVVESVCKLFSELAIKNQTKLSLESQLSGLLCSIDKDKIESIIFNLLTNAFKHTGKSDSIRVIIKLKLENQIQIEVRDTGSGIQKEKLQEVFSMFYSEDNKDNSIQKGTGIGLALVKELISLMKGEIHVESTKSTDTVFTIDLPTEVVSQEVRKKEINISTKTLPNYIKSDWKETVKKERNLLRLLVVEDDWEMNNYIAMQFENQYKVFQASNGKEAFQLAMTTPPELIISDLMMPEMDGIELCSKLKSELTTSHIPIVMLTAKADNEDKLKGIETGADAYLTKPFSTDLLVATVSKMVESRKRLHEKYSNSLQIEPSGITITSVDEQFMQTVLDTVNKYIDNSSFTVEQLSKEVGASTPQLYRKVKAITGLGPNELIRDIRLKRAALLLKESGLTVSEISYRVGFSNPKYFSRCFNQQFKTSPSMFRKSNISLENKR